MESTQDRARFGRPTADSGDIRHNRGAGADNRILMYKIRPDRVFIFTAGTQYDDYAHD